MNDRVTEELGAAGPSAPMPPEHILASFQVPAAHPVLLEDSWGQGWRCERAVISRSAPQDQAAWVARVMTRVRPAGVSVSRPIVSSDGRFSVSGWRARTFLSGHGAPRFDEMAAAALRMNEALVGEPRPTFLLPPDPAQPFGEAEIFRAADAAAFAPDPSVWITAVLDPQAVPREDVAQALVRAARAAGLRGKIGEREQLVHGDIAGCVIFDGVADPAVTDLVPMWHPTAWSVALMVVDSMAWAGGPDALLDRWQHLPDFWELALRAVMYRLFVHALHPQSRAVAWPGLARVADVVMARMEAMRAEERG
ncbi:TIGR02569 family protein [Corynebacterium heidelbergense]|nr:TIGR02569 family protein [Corynebacterium heidelbergense]